MAPVWGLCCSISTSTVRPTQRWLRSSEIGCCRAISASFRAWATSGSTRLGRSAAAVPSSGEKVNTPT